MCATGSLAVRAIAVIPPTPVLATCGDKSATRVRNVTIRLRFIASSLSNTPPYDLAFVVRELVAGPHREPDFRDRALLERFWFDTTAQYAPVRMLSGGERRRLQLVMVLATEPNLLILDEPTNDLDLDTLRALESFLDEWPGALVVASHDPNVHEAADWLFELKDGWLVGTVDQTN